MTARRLLEMPPAVVVGFYVLAIGVPMILESFLPHAMPAFVSALLDWAFWLCALIWAFALFTVAREAIRMGSGAVGKAIFCLALALIVVSIGLQTWFGSPMQWFDSSLIAILFVSVFCAVISLGFAASSLDTFEGGNGWPFKEATVWTWFAMLFLPIGVWFLRGRVQRLLAQTA